MTKIVRTESLVDLDAWIASLGKLSGRLGAVAFVQIGNLRDQWRDIQSSQSHLEQYKFNSPVELSFRDTDFDYLDNAEIQEDLSALYECALVHASLGLSLDFKEHFQNELKVQRDYLIPSSLSITQEEVDGETVDSFKDIEEVLHSVAGFCIIDKIVSRRIKGLRLQDDVDEFWTSICQKLLSVLTSLLSSISDLDTLRNLRSIFILFMLTMQNFEFSIVAPQNFLIKIFNQYEKQLRDKFVEGFAVIAQDDDSMPMHIKSQELYQKIATICWYEITDADLNKPLPLMFPFSQAYPLTCAEIRNILESLKSFMSDLDHNEREVQTLIKNSIDKLLVDTVCKTFEERLKSTAREQVVQILINMEYFESASKQVEKALTENVRAGHGVPVTLQATEKFRQVGKKAEERIFELINAIVDDFLEIADYDWLTTTKNTAPSTYLTEMVPFLKTVMNSSLVNLPYGIRSFLYLDAFDHLCSSLLKFLIDSSDSLTVAAVENFNLDVQYLEEFISELARDSNDPSLTTTVLELRQSIDLLRSQNINDYNNTLIRMKKYDRVRPDNAQTLFNKVNHARSVSQGSTDSNVGGTTKTSSKIMRYYRKLNSKNDSNDSAQGM